MHSLPAPRALSLRCHRPRAPGQATGGARAALLCGPRPRGTQRTTAAPPGTAVRGRTMGFVFQFREWKVKKPFSYEHIFLQGTVRKMLMWCLNTFYYNAINYIKTQLSHCFKILKYYSAKTQKGIFRAPQSLSPGPCALPPPPRAPPPPPRAASAPRPGHPGSRDTHTANRSGRRAISGPGGPRHLAAGHARKGPRGPGLVSLQLRPVSRPPDAAGSPARPQGLGTSVCPAGSYVKPWGSPHLHIRFWTHGGGGC